MAEECSSRYVVSLLRITRNWSFFVLTQSFFFKFLVIFMAEITLFLVEGYSKKSLRMFKKFTRTFTWLRDEIILKLKSPESRNSLKAKTGSASSGDPRGKVALRSRWAVTSVTCLLVAASVHPWIKIRNVSGCQTAKHSSKQDSAGCNVASVPWVFFWSTCIVREHFSLL